jgi:hypothetical protein
VRDDRDIANFVCGEHGRSAAKGGALYRHSALLVAFLAPFFCCHGLD